MDWPLSCYGWRNKLRHDYVNLVHRVWLRSSDCIARLGNFHGRGSGRERGRNRAGLSLYSCTEVQKQGRHSGAGDFGIDATDSASSLKSVPQKCASKVCLKSVPQKSNKCGHRNILRRLLPSLESTVKPHCRTSLHPRRHERVAESFRLTFTLPCRRFILGRAAGER